MNRFVTVSLFVAVILYLSGQRVYCRQTGQNGRPTQTNTIEEVAALEAQARDLLYRGGDYDSGLRKYKKVLAIKESKAGMDNAELSGTWMDIALCYRAIGDYANAEGAYKRALAEREKRFGSSHIDVARTLRRYSCLLRRVGTKEEADSLSRRANSILSTGEHRSGPITGVVVNGTRISVPQPEYPKYARENRISGSVKVDVTIGEDGKIVEACAVEGPSGLALVSEDAALRATFTPTTLDGVPVRASVVIYYNFKH